MMEQGASLAVIYRAVYIHKVNFAFYFVLKSLRKINSKQET